MTRRPSATYRADLLSRTGADELLVSTATLDLDAFAESDERPARLLVALTR